MLVHAGEPILGVNFYYDKSMLFDSMQKEISGQSTRSIREIDSSN